MFSTLVIQNGPIGETGVNGDQIDDILVACYDILNKFNTSPFNCRENSIALTKLDEAILWLAKRRHDRLCRGVEGTNKP